MMLLMSNRHYLLKGVSCMSLNMTFLVTKTPDLSAYLDSIICAYM